MASRVVLVAEPGDEAIEDGEAIDLIEADPAVVHGQARTRIPVSVVLDCLAAGMSEDEVRRQYPTLPDGAVRAALAYAALLAREELHPLTPAPG